MSESGEKDKTAPTGVPEEARDDLAEKPGTDSVDKEHEDELVD